MLQKLTAVIYPHSEFDVESGMLRSANKAPCAPSDRVPDGKRAAFLRPSASPNLFGMKTPRWQE
ncbi:hypothetical protein ACH79_28665 [Bradyrhizobium sp. CCBAU 051011]|nr:hypothetical protein ACH79_28665 [Bradyrhizobium sp. CCBAU 051011]